MNDKKINELIKPIIDIYDNLELEIVKDIANRFDNYDTLGGTLEWRLKKLDELGTFSNDMVELISEYTNKSKKEILQMLEEAQENTFNIDYLNKAYENGMIKVNPMKVLKSPTFENIISNSYKELNKTFRMINTKALENVNQSYMDIINTAYVEVASGVFDYQSSIKRALNKMAEKGIKCASYERKDGTIVKYSLQGTIKRDIVTAIIQTACKSSMKMCEELDAEYVEVTSHLGARTGDGVNPITNHAHWQGKVYKLKGSDKYDNFYTSTGYGDILGLGGVNCRHNFYPYFPGIDEPSQPHYDEEENKKEYERQQKLNRLNRKKQQQNRIKEVAIHNEDKDQIKEINKEIKKIDNEVKNVDEVKLTDNEQYALNKYMGFESYTYNEKLRNDIPLDENETKILNNLDKVLDKMPKYANTVTRSVSISSDDINYFLKDYKEGYVIQYKAYMSTTKGDIYNPDARVQMAIKSKNGRDISKYNKEEQEILFKRNSKFNVIKVDTSDDFYVRIELEEV
mgnify:FL=1|nr:MAG TPA: minor capsid protein [Caudoviricetes sp.]